MEAVSGQQGGGKKRRRGHKTPSRQLRDMRWAYDHPDDAGATPGQKRYQDWLKADFAKYNALLAKLESDHAQGAKVAREVPPPAASPDPAIVDVPFPKQECQKLAEEMLAEWGDQ